MVGFKYTFWNQIRIQLGQIKFKYKDIAFQFKYNWASLCQAMPSRLLVIFICIWLYLQILFKYRPHIKYKYMPFCKFQYKYKKILYTNTNANRIWAQPCKTTFWNHSILANDRLCWLTLLTLTHNHQCRHCHSFHLSVRRQADRTSS